ncbi:MAG: metal-dependent hydrolase [Verrucomicrobiota bacterium]
MDSITQAALGAAVAEAGLGKRIGNKAILWGLLFGTLPDLDIIVYPFLDTADQLSWHRGLSHSFLFMILGAPLLGALLHKVHKEKAPFRTATLTCFWILFTHALIDCFTVYGTQIFEPVSDHRAGLNNLFIIDLLYTIPILAGLTASLFLKRTGKARFWANSAGLILSSLYVVWSFGAKGLIHHRIHSELERQNISYHRVMTHPTPFNTVLWRALIENEEGYYVGYASLLDSDPKVDLRFIPRKAHLLAPVKETRSVQRLLWFSKGYYMVRVRDEQLQFSDLRFGEFEHPDGTLSSIFTWAIEPGGRDSTIQQVRRKVPEGAFSKIWERLLGNREEAQMDLDELGQQPTS